MLASIPANLQLCDGERLTVEIRIGNRLAKVGGLARYSSGNLTVSVRDPDGDFDVVFDETTWNGDVRRVGAGSYSVRVECQDGS